uniref:Myb/SANT-like DNA-binding domain-containing protein n=1 Tax=Nothobranchius furzeri TaxID=105023 RepID=A0A8C6LXV0_NOTFU
MGLGAGVGGPGLSWTGKGEVKIFLSLLADDRIQHKLDGSVRNKNIFQGLAQTMSTHGYERISKQCREKFKKLKAEYRSVKVQNSRSGADRRYWKWFADMDAIYGERPVSNGRESGVDTATPAYSTTVMRTECCASFG